MGSARSAANHLPPPPRPVVFTMPIKIFTLRFLESLDGFDDEHMRVFLADKEIISTRAHFFVKDGVPYWTVMAAYGQGPGSGPEATGKGGKGVGNKGASIQLDENSMPLFNLLKDWRKERAQRDGVPHFVIFSNRQLADIAAKAPASLAQLSAISGVGKAKLQMYGKEVLAAVSSMTGKRTGRAQASDPALSQQKSESKKGEAPKEQAREDRAEGDSIAPDKGPVDKGGGGNRDAS